MDCDSGRTVLFDHPDMTVVLQNDQRLPCSPEEVLDSLWISNSPPRPPHHPSFHGDSGSCSNSIINFAAAAAAAADNTNNNRQFLLNDTKMEEKDVNDNEDCDVYFHKPEKKRRLKSEQVHSLEKIFEVDNKLEPERKVELANELGLQPRQVAIWFQNRRARFKTKQLEKDYGSLKARFDKLQSDHGSLLQERETLRNKVLQLKEQLKERSISYPDYEMGSDSQKSESKDKAAPPPVKTEDVSSTKSDVVDSESPHWVEGRSHWCSTSSQIEVAESYQVVSGEEEDEDNNNNSLNKKKKGVYEAPCFPKVEEEGEYYSDPSANCCNWEFQVEEQPSSWFWPY